MHEMAEKKFEGWARATPFRPLPGLSKARTASTPAERLRQLTRAASTAREALLNEGSVDAVVSCRLVTFPYPSLYAFSGMSRSPAPYVMLTNRMLVVQFREHGERRTLLFNPTDTLRGREAPFYKGLAERYGSFLSHRVLSHEHGTVASHLAQLGLRPEDIDYIAFDHLHIQDLRGWLGGEGPAFFPDAKLIVQRAEWESVKDLHPFEAAWYVPNGVRGVPEDRVIVIDGDAWLGKGVAIVSTPGHTWGNMSLAVVTPDGLTVTSENGIAVESYSPERSQIPGIRDNARHLGLDIVLNGNTREGSLEQYTSMIVERTLAGANTREPAFFNVFPSSELTGSIVAPGLAPTFSFGELDFGTIRRG